MYLDVFGVRISCFYWMPRQAGMTGKSGVIANGVGQSVRRLLRRFTTRNDGVWRLLRRFKTRNDKGGRWVFLIKIFMEIHP